MWEGEDMRQEMVSFLKKKRAGSMTSRNRTLFSFLEPMARRKSFFSGTKSSNSAYGKSISAPRHPTSPAF